MFFSWSLSTHTDVCDLQQRHIALRGGDFNESDCAAQAKREIITVQ